MTFDHTIDEAATRRDTRAAAVAMPIATPRPATVASKAAAMPGAMAALPGCR
mgnify:CR=1 FL=1